MFNWSDPNTFWLNITDIALGIVTLACVAFVAQAAFREVYARLLNRSSARPQQDSHVFVLPELGLTMADGGEPIPPKTRNNDQQ
jgi:hypothetical protein